jgi:ABC-type hemin transport system substrate-binding protein
VSRIGQDPNGIVSRVGQDLNGIVSRVGQDPNGIVSRVGGSLNGSVHLICTINQEYFLEVNPDVVWLTQDMLSGEVEIKSNVVWEIV